MASKINKVLVGCILAFSLVLVCSVTMAAAQPAKIVGAGVNVRKAPNTSAGVITKLTNSRVSVIDKSSGWFKISFNGKTGWVNNDYVQVLTSKGSINANDVNFRESASTTGKIIDSLKKGTSVEILDTIKGWNKIKVGSKVGYVTTKYVTSTSSTKSSRSTQAAKITTDDSVSTTQTTYDDSTSSQVINYAKKFLGVRYVYGGTTPKGFDCSGFVGYVFKKVGVKLNRTAAGLKSNGHSVSKADLKPGDIVLFGSGSGISHTGIYIGGDKFIHASSGKHKIVISCFSEYKGYKGARRVI
jgi:cell wall-associated NlpC family hydrolase